MGGESANDWMDEAIRGEEVPASERTLYNADHIFELGSANICVMQAANDAWYCWHRPALAQRFRDVMAAWRRYFTAKGRSYVYQSETFGGCFRYRTWQFMSWVVMHALAELAGDDELRRKLEAWLLWVFYTASLSAAWWKHLDGDGSGRVHPVAWAGARSWVGPEDPGGGRSVPYQGLPQGGTTGPDLANMLGIRSAADWELEPLLQTLEREVAGFRRWSYISDEDKELVQDIVDINGPMNDSERESLAELARRIEATEAVSHVAANFFRTTKGVGMMLERSWASGSTSFKYGSICVRDGVKQSEFPEGYDVDPIWGYLYAATLNRRSDPSGTADYEVHNDKVVMRCRTNAGAAANGFEPGAGRHYAPWLGGSRDHAAWPQSDRAITLPGEIIYHVRIPANRAEVQIMAGIGDPGDPTPPPDPPATGGGRTPRGHVRAAIRKAKRSIREPGQPDLELVKQARKQLNKAIAKIEET